MDAQHRTVVALQPVPHGVSRPLGKSILPMSTNADGSAFEITCRAKRENSSAFNSDANQQSARIGPTACPPKQGLNEHTD